MFGRKRRARLAHENAALREALDWYATAANWRKKGTNPKGTTPRTWTKSPAAFDRGARAKFVLTQLDSKRTPPTVPAPRTHLTREPATADVLARGPGMDTE